MREPSGPRSNSICGTRELQRFANSGPSVVSTAGHVPLLLPDTSKDIDEQNDAKTAGVAVASGVVDRRMRALLSRDEGISIDGTGTVSPATSDQGQYCIITPGGF